jgi:hypothetical protein
MPVIDDAGKVIGKYVRVLNKREEKDEKRIQGIKIEVE